MASRPPAADDPWKHCDYDVKKVLLTPSLLREVAGLKKDIFPINSLTIPEKKSNSSRLRARNKRKIELCKMANELISVLNAARKGRCKDPTYFKQSVDEDFGQKTARMNFHKICLKECQRLLRERRNLGLTGVAAVERATKRSGLNDYHSRPRGFGSGTVEGVVVG